MQKWEYSYLYTRISDMHTKTEIDFLEEKSFDGKTTFEMMSSLGQKGWELVSVTPVSAFQWQGDTCWLLYTFKRPVS